MGCFDHVLIVSDVDGTFLGRGGRLVEANLSALDAYRREGGLFTFATGRMHTNLLAAVPAGRVANVPAVLANGTYLYDFAAGCAVREVFLEPEAVLGAIRLAADRYPDCGVRVSTARGFLTNSLKGIIGCDLEKCPPEQVAVLPIDEWTGENWYKVVVRGAAERLDALRAEIAAAWPDAFSLCKSAPTFLEFQKKGCSKASMLAELRKMCAAEHPGLRVYAVGDYENDLEMLRAADVAVCPSNALPAVKAEADLCLCSHDDGVIAALIAHLREERGVG